MEVIKRGAHRLRDLEEQDLQLVLNWRNSDRLRKVSNSDHIISFEEHQAWFERTKDSANSKGLIFENGKGPLGVVNIMEIDAKNSRCRWGFYLGEEPASRGLGGLMGFLALEYIFEQLQLQKVCAEVLALNVRGVDFHKKMGFVEEGRLVRHIFRDGHWWDVFLMAHFKDVWDKKKKTLEEICLPKVHP